MLQKQSSAAGKKFKSFSIFIEMANSTDSSAQQQIPVLDVQEDNMDPSNFRGH